MDNFSDFYLVFFETGSLCSPSSMALSMQPSLFLNLSQSSCFNLLSAVITRTCHHTQLWLTFITWSDVLLFSFFHFWFFTMRLENTIWFPLDLKIWYNICMMIQQVRLNFWLLHDVVVLHVSASVFCMCVCVCIYIAKIFLTPNKEEKFHTIYHWK